MNDTLLGRVSHTTRPRYSLLFWDWNGTLLNDRDYAIQVRNRVFPRFGLPAIDSLEAYYAQFTFPVKLYYERAGVTEENFVSVANAWMAEYVRGAEAIPLQSGACLALETMKAAGLRQVVLSASDLSILQQQLDFYHIRAYFSEVLGLNHIYATSKQAIGQAYLQTCGVPPAACVLLGDTLHDAEVAQEMGIDCILVAQGHQSAQTLLTSGMPVYPNLEEAVTAVLA